MKKNVSILSFLLSIGMIILLTNYTKWPFDYHLAEFISYIIVWCVVLFVFSLVFFKLENTKYRKWFLFTLIFIILSVLLAYITGDGNGGILSIDGELITWFFAGLYSLISIIYFIVQFIKNRANKLI